MKNLFKIIKILLCVFVILLIITCGVVIVFLTIPPENPMAFISITIDRVYIIPVVITVVIFIFYLIKYIKNIWRKD